MTLGIFARAMKAGLSKFGEPSSLDGVVIGKVAIEPDGDHGQGDLMRLIGLMRGFQQGIEDILYRQGVEPFHVDGEAFDPRRQRAVVAIPTEDPSQNKAVAERLRKGFRSGDRVIRPEIVSVYAVKKAT